MTSFQSTPIFAFASGKGGVGKTSICLNLAHLLAKKGKKVAVFDGDFGLANADVQLGLTTEKDLSDVLRGQATLQDIMVKSDKGFWLIPGRSGTQNLPFMNALQRHNLLEELKQLAASFDAVFIDVPAGLDENVLSLCTCADKTLLVTTPDPSAITDAYAIIKLLAKRYDNQSCHLIANQAASVTEGQQTATKIVTAAKNFLGVSVPVFGQVPYDRNYAAAVKMQQLVTQAFPNTKASEGLSTLANQIIDNLDYPRRLTG
ncbi:MAG: MinD/ParA family protein [Alphaproteobacteria bacterium]|nr:MinD/ParA family protein [Alphaproteobacteria bacterium]MDD9919613.1 MinD/ParA family protein [Alphaproteobacteria bacterium]